MRVYVDELFDWKATGTQAQRVGARNGHKWCHMWTDPGNELELHILARKIGMERAWFQDRKGFPHYDLTPARREAALRAGARERTLQSWLRARDSGAKGLFESVTERTFVRMAWDRLPLRLQSYWATLYHRKTVEGIEPSAQEVIAGMP